MFFQKYQGNAVESFIDGLDVYSNIYDQKRHYGQCITLVQSSGTGKSRLIRELGKKVRVSSTPDHQSKLNDQFTGGTNPQRLLPKKSPTNIWLATRR